MAQEKCWGGGGNCPGCPAPICVHVPLIGAAPEPHWSVSDCEWNVSFEIVSIFELRAGCPNLGHGTLSVYINNLVK